MGDRVPIIIERCEAGAKEGCGMEALQGETRRGDDGLIDDVARVDRDEHIAQQVGSRRLFRPCAEHLNAG